MAVAEQGRANLEPAFGRHETFAPRYGWFKKAVDGVAADPEVFNADDATLRLGVGKNMVRSIRFWAAAAHVVHVEKVGRREQLSLTRFGETLFDERGWDPYLELPATLWLLHWRMFEPKCQLPVWWFALNDLAQPDFTAGGLTKLAMEAVSVVYGFKEPAESSVKRDVECLVHTYARRTEGRIAADDALACPFRALGLVDQEPGRAGTYRFRTGPKPNLPAEIVAFAALDFSARHMGASRSVALGRLLRDPGSPGRIFKLDEDSVISALMQVSHNRTDLLFTDTAGVSALQVGEDPHGIALDVLNSYYARVTGTTRCLDTLRDEKDLISVSEAPTAARRRGGRKPRAARD
jgi:hypothetical protein